MPQIKLGDVDIEDFIDVSLNLLSKHNLNTVKIHYFSIEIDDEISEEVSVGNLKKRILDLDIDSEVILNWGININEILCVFDYDGSDFYLTYPEKLESEMNSFRDLS